MNTSIDSTYQVVGSDENANNLMLAWSEEDIEELQDETPWEIFSSEIDNWAAINMHSTDL